MTRTVARLALLAVASVALSTGCATVATSDPVPTVQLAYDATDTQLWEALRTAGYRGIPEDGCECLYVPEYTVVDIPGGTWTVTPDTGPRLCEDGTPTDNGAPFECTGWEFIPE